MNYLEGVGPTLVARTSNTAMIAATLRGQHRELHEQPWVFDHTYALTLVSPGWTDLGEQLRGVADDPVNWGVTGSVTARSRNTEDRLDTGAFDQYVILGAELESFA